MRYFPKQKISINNFSINKKPPSGGFLFESVLLILPTEKQLAVKSRQFTKAITAMNYQPRTMNSPNHKQQTTNIKIYGKDF